jgi:hypothetical protein
MSLQEKLSGQRAQFEATAPKETLAIMHRATDDLRRSGIIERALKKGDTAPAFELPNADGQTIRSADLLSRGPLVVTFYRGHW